MEASHTTQPSESQHWYAQDGSPAYETPCTSKEGMRPTTIRDARAKNLVPSVTMILNCMAKPGLEAWKSRNVLEASLTLPKETDESLDAYAKRVMEDAKAQSVAAAGRGVQLHAAIEHYISNGRYVEAQWQEHVNKLDQTLQQHGIDIQSGRPEHSFSAGINDLFFGGKVDYFTRGSEALVCDFKSKKNIENDKRLAWDEHLLQLSAYGFGLFSVISSTKTWKWQPFRAVNVFIGCDDCEIRVVEHEPADIEYAFSMFTDILSYWYKKNQFGPFSKQK